MKIVLTVLEIIIFIPLVLIWILKAWSSCPFNGLFCFPVFTEIILTVITIGLISGLEWIKEKFTD